MRKIYLLLFFIFSISCAYSQVNIAVGGSYTQDFDAALGTTSVAPYTNNVTFTGWYITSANLNINTGSNNANAVYNFGATGTNPLTDRALGAISTATTHRFGLRLLNNGATNITSFVINFTGEQWRSFNAGTLAFEYQTGTTVTSLTTGTWIPFTTLDFASLATSGGSALDGNAPANRTAKSGALAVDVPAGTEILFRWTKAGSSSPGLAIDDLSITANGGAASPSVTSPAATAITTSTATLGANLLTDGGSPITSRGFVWSVSNTDPVIGAPDVNNVLEGGTTTGTFTSDLIGLSSGTQVYFKAYATNSSGTAYTSVTSFTTLKLEPGNQASAFTCGTTTSTSIPLTWTDAAGSTIPDGYLIRWSTVDFASIVDPADGTATPNGAGNLNVAAGVQAVTIIGLTQNTTYYFKIYAYTNTGVNINYKTDGTIPQTSCSTTAGLWEEFEVGSKGSYATGTVNLSSGSWTFTDALLGNLANDRKNGTQSARIQNSGSLTMNFDVPTGVGYVTINHAAYGTDAASTWHLEASTDGGASWTAYIGPNVTTTATTLTAATFLVKVPLPGGVKLLPETLVPEKTPPAGEPVSVITVLFVQSGP